MQNKLNESKTTKAERCKCYLEENSTEYREKETL